MTEFILPRLSPDRATQLIEEAREWDVPKLARAASKRRASDETFAVLGKANIEDEALDEIGGELREIARRYGYPDAPKNRTRFDIETAVLLHERVPTARGELLRREVWQYFSCALAPDIVVWRWRKEGKELNPDRFDGGVRDCFGRLWRRADVLRDERLPDPWTPVRSLGEDNVTTIIERPKTARHRLLVREAARAFLLRRELVKTSDRESAAEELLRQMMLRLNRRGAHMAYSALRHDEVIAAVADIADSTLKAFGVSPVDEKRLISQHPELEVVAAAGDVDARPARDQSDGSLLKKIRGLVGRRG